MARSLTLGLLLSALLLSRAAAAADPVFDAMDPSAREHLKRGAAHYEAKRYELAITEFRAGYGIEPRPEFLFAWAQAERLRGNCPSAIDLYEKFLDTDPEKRQAEVAGYHLRRCEEVAPSPWYADVLGGVLTGAGVAVVAVGVGFYASSRADEKSAQSSSSYREHEDLIQDARRSRAISFVGFGVGAGLIVAGVTRYIGASKPKGPAEISLVVGPEQSFVGIRSSF